MFKITRKIELLLLSIVVSIGFLLSIAVADDCIYTDVVDENSTLWWDKDGVLITKYYDKTERYPLSMGGGTGIMTRGYFKDEMDEDPLPVLIIDLSDKARLGSPTSAVVAHGNLYWSNCLLTEE